MPGENSFAGFPAGKVRSTAIPVTFFSELLPKIDHLGELKVTLYTLWFLERQEGPVHYILFNDFINDQSFMEGLGETEEAAKSALAEALERAVQRGTLLGSSIKGTAADKMIYFLNSPKGRAAFQALQHGKWSPNAESHPPVTLKMERPNIYRLYEENIGPLTPIIADTLRDAEKTYSEEAIKDAIQIAVENNVRKWSYIEAILRSWQEEGRDAANRRDSQKDSRRYIQGEFGKYIKH
jgi:DNA replication protein